MYTLFFHEVRILCPSRSEQIRVVPLTPLAAEVLTVLSRVSGNPKVLPGRKRGTHRLQAVTRS